MQELKNELTGDVFRTFVDGGVVLSIYAYGIMQPLKPNKTCGFALGRGQTPEMNKFFADDKISFKNIPDLIKLLKYDRGNK